MSDLSGLSDLQLNIYRYIKDYINKKGVSPTYREIKEEMDFRHIGNVEHHLDKLQAANLISRQPGAHRSIKLTDQVPGIPVKGAIAAGQQLEIYSDVDEWLNIDMDGELGKGNFYALTVRGDSMIGDYINDGDYVLVKEQSSYDDEGDIVVTVHEENSVVSSTLKRVEKNRKLKKIYLQPSNENQDPIEIDEKVWEREWKIQGKAVAVYRRVGETSKSRARARPNYRKQK